MNHLLDKNKIPLSIIVAALVIAASIWLSKRPPSAAPQSVQTSQQSPDYDDIARITTTKANLKMLHNAVAQFKMDTGRYPTQKEELSVLITPPSDVKGYQPGGYINSTTIPKDAWGHDFVYVDHPESGKPYVIVSYGADGKKGGEGFDADLYSTDE
jgi:general secretion pathway protein G